MADPVPNYLSIINNAVPFTNKLTLAQLGQKYAACSDKQNVNLSLT